MSGVLFSASCSSSSHDEPQQEQATSNSQQTVSIPLQAEVQLDEFVRSLIYTVGNDGCFQYKLKDATIPLFTTIRDSWPGKAQYSARLSWKVDVKTNTLYLHQTVSIIGALRQVMEEGIWYASVAYSSVNTTPYLLSGKCGSGQTFYCLDFFLRRRI